METRRNLHWGSGAYKWAVCVGSRVVDPHSFSLIHFFPSSNILGSCGGSSCLFNHNEGEPTLGTPHNGSLCIAPDRPKKKKKLTAFESMLEPNTHFTVAY